MNPRPPRIFVLLATTGSALVLAACGADTSGGPSAASGTSTAPSAAPSHDVSDEMRALERRYDARVGVHAVDTGDGATVAYRSDERFGYASTFKALLAGEVLRRLGPDEREERVTWTQADVDAAGHAPVTSRHVADGLTVAQLAEAAVRHSDNAATNLVLERIGGPAGLQAGLRRVGDTTTQVVNREPDLNTIEPGSHDDTTTPAAFTADLGAYLDGTVLSAADRDLLVGWMSGNATGDTLIRAGAPDGWEVADKSGGAGGIRNDLAFVTRPGDDPVVITILTVRNDADAAYDDELVAHVARAALAAMA